MTTTHHSLTKGLWVEVSPGAAVVSVKRGTVALSVGTTAPAALKDAHTLSPKGTTSFSHNLSQKTWCTSTDSDGAEIVVTTS